MIFAGVVMYFIILTTGATLYSTGQRDIETAKQAAEALRPLAGNAAYLLFTVGLVGTGMLGIPALAGSAAYAVSEAMHWRGSLNARPRHAVKVNGVLAPPLIVLVTMLTSDKKVMGSRTNPWILKWAGWATAVVMTGAAIAMFSV